MDKYTKPEICGLPTAEELRAALDNGSSDTRAQIAMIFDEGTFVETGAFITRGFSDFMSTEQSNEFEGVITGYGAIDGKLAFVFAEDASRMGGAIDERHAKKIVDLYALATKNGAPVVGIFNSNGTDIFAGTAGLAAYGKIITCVSEASGVIPQIAFVTGKCIGLASAISALFDFTVKTNDALLYVSSPALTGANDAQDAIVAFTGEMAQCAGYIRGLLSFLPCNSSVGVIVEVCNDNLNRMLGDIDFAGDAHAMIATLADNGVMYEISSDFSNAVITAFTTIGGVRCGIIANSFNINEGRLDVKAARKISRFVGFCDAFSLPIVTLVDSLGLTIEPANEASFFAPELAKLGSAYALASVPMITVIAGHAIGAPFVLLGSKALGADVVYSVDNAEICALSAESGVAFAWDKYITVEKSRDELISEWKNSVSSPARAAASGEIDDIIGINELRARICSALLMLSDKGQNSLMGLKVLPL